MADRSFEQQVKAQLADFRMKPDAAVWLDVAAALHKERKRHWLIWLFLLLAGCSGASFWAYYQFHQPEQQETVSVTKTTMPAEQLSKGKNTATVTKKIQTTKPIQPLVSKKIPFINKTEKKRQPTMATEKDKKTLPAQSMAKMVNDLVVNSKKIVLPGQLEVNIDTPNAGKTTVIEKPVGAEKAITIQNNDTVFVTNKQEPSEQEMLPKLPRIESDTLVTTTKKKKINKWQWNIAVDAGSSVVRRSLGNATVVYANTNPSTLTGNTIGQSSNTTPVIKDAFSFGVQLQATKQISKKHSIGLSVGYSLLQTGTSVGRRVDSTVFFSAISSNNTNGYYYYSKDSVKYTNQYHFLRAGVDLYTPFRLFKTVQMRWQLGTGLDIMIVTNGLNYDANSGRLFRNSAVMTTLQTHVSTGFDISIGKRPFLYIGPQWQYFISNLSKQTGTDQHLFLSAIKISFILTKNKK